jgi:hypothetical protein
MKRITTANSTFASGGVTFKLGALCLYSSSVQVDPEVSGCSETRPNTKPEKVVNNLSHRERNSKNEY